jgi:hypothetical protein
MPLVLEGVRRAGLGVARFQRRFKDTANTKKANTKKGRGRCATF